ncbi:unnamed protein product [Rotaria socialis]|uniref:Uncharacterized protein n=2 Tax=Rotaria socialis TaxID=392032 RepID=A0A817SYJ4_9BILA|nr:unnamed protein product [Rotaria socialis]CAF3428895.1 unnamed protein product [Rotaria socialis]
MKNTNNLNALKNNSQLTLSISTTSSTSSTHTIQLVDSNKPLLFDDQVSQAEILWALKSVQNVFSYKNSDDIGKLFRTMFQDSKIAQKFSIQHSKISYVIAHGLWPYFRDLLIKDIKNCEGFVLCFDEQTNNQNNKQLDLYFRYWNHAQANVVVDGILGAFRTDGIDISKLLMLSRDNPNVNKTVDKMINDAMKKKVNAELLNIGTCNLHVIHNGFRAGMDSVTKIKLCLTGRGSTSTFSGHIRIRSCDIVSRRQIDISCIVDNLKKHLPLKNTFLKDLHVLDPVSRTKQDSADTMIRVGRAIPKLLSNAEIDRIRHEFMMYAAETIDQSWYIKNKYHDSDDNNHTEYQQIDYYWNKTLSLTTSFGLPKYPTLSKVVKNIFIISHGNSDVERGFSINEHIVTENRTLLSLSSINGLRSTWDAIKFYGVGSPHRVPIKIDMIRAVQKSKSVYNQEQLSLKSLADREKEQSEKHQRTNEEVKKLIDRENQLLSKQKGLHDKQKKAQLLVDEGRQRLDNALKKADIIDAQAANALIGAGDEQVKLISDKLFKITDELLKIQSKRKNVLSHVQNKKQKMTTTSE